MSGFNVVDSSAWLEYLADTPRAAHHKLPLADSIIYATALHRGATLWTQDEHFEDLPGVRYFAKG